MAVAIPMAPGHVATTNALHTYGSDASVIFESTSYAISQDTTAATLTATKQRVVVAVSPARRIAFAMNRNTIPRLYASGKRVLASSHDEITCEIT